MHTLISALRRQRQEDHKLEASLSYNEIKKGRERWEGERGREERKKGREGGWEGGRERKEKERKRRRKEGRKEGRKKRRKEGRKKNKLLGLLWWRQDLCHSYNMDGKNKKQKALAAMEVRNTVSAFRPKSSQVRAAQKSKQEAYGRVVPCCQHWSPKSSMVQKFLVLILQMFVVVLKI
jgi:hypothetical protein